MKTWKLGRAAVRHVLNYAGVLLFVVRGLARCGAVLTAFLATQNADPELIAVFRICAARSSGFLGIAVFSRCSRVVTDESVSGARSA